MVKDQIPKLETQNITILGSRENLEGGTRSHIAGWGYDYDHESEKYTLVEDMQNVTIKIVDSKDCEGKLGNDLDLSDNLRFCAGLEEGGHDSCQVGISSCFTIGTITFGPHTVMENEYGTLSK